MRKIKTYFIFLLLLSTVFFISCGNNVKEKAIDQEKVQALENKKDNENVTNNSSNDNTQNAESTKQLYLDKLNNLDLEVSAILSDDKYNGTTLDIREGFAIKLQKWDDMLNEIYDVLIEQLPKDEMDAIREEQIEWISIRDAKANESGKKYEGGTMQPVAYSDSLGESTKERCYELVNKYMK